MALPERHRGRSLQSASAPSPQHRVDLPICQLAHVIEQAYVLETTPTLPSSEQKNVDLNLRLPYLNLDKLRYEAVRQALTSTQGHKGRAAQLLGVHANTLTRMISEFKMTPSQWNTAVAGAATVSVN